MATVHIPEAEAIANLGTLLDRVRAGEEILIEKDSRVVAILSPGKPPERTLKECIALLPPDSDGMMDEDFAADVAAAIAFHREPLNPPAWD